jgi:hypothetical protein
LLGQPFAALKLAPLVFVRPGELRAAEWSEFELANAEGRIPGARMKMGEPHIVPLSRQALAILREVEPLARGGRYLFPSLRTRDYPMSNNTINAARVRPCRSSGARFSVSSRIQDTVQELNARGGRQELDMAKRKNRLGVAPFDASDYLDRGKVIAEYLAAALEDPNPKLHATAIDLKAAIWERPLRGDESFARVGLKSSY